MGYRAAVDPKGVVIAIALDVGQKGPYGKEGAWQDFTIKAIPAISPDVKSDIDQKMRIGAKPPMAFSSDGSSIVPMDLNTISAKEASK